MKVIVVLAPAAKVPGLARPLLVPMNPTVTGAEQELMKVMGESARTEEMAAAVRIN